MTQSSEFRIIDSLPVPSHGLCMVFRNKYANEKRKGFLTHESCVTKKIGLSKKAKHLFIEKDACVNYKTNKFPMTVRTEIDLNFKVGG